MLVQYVQFLPRRKLNLICTAMRLWVFDCVGVLADSGDFSLGEGA